MSLQAWWMVHVSDVAARLALLEQELQHRRLVAEQTEAMLARRLANWDAWGAVVH